MFALLNLTHCFPENSLQHNPAQYIPGVLIVVLSAMFFIGSNLAPLGLFFLFFCHLFLVGAATALDRQFLHVKAMSSVFFSYLFLLFTN
jgi:membrane-bound ClpP family serine protease